MATKIDFKKAFTEAEPATGETSGKPVIKELFAIVSASTHGITGKGDFKNMFTFELTDGNFGFSMTSLNKAVEIERIELTNLFLMTKTPEHFDFKGKRFFKYSSRSIVHPKQNPKNDLPFEV